MWPSFWLSNAYSSYQRQSGQPDYDSTVYGYQPPTTHPLSQAPEPNPYEYNFDEDAVRHDAQRRANAALAGGMVSAYLGHGNIGDAFHAQQAVYSHEMDSARDDARQQALDHARAQEWSLSRQDRLQQEQDRQEARQAMEDERHAHIDALTHKAADEQAQHQRIQDYLKAHPEQDFSGLSDEDIAGYLKQQKLDALKPKPAPHLSSYSPGSYIYDEDARKVVGHLPERPEKPHAEHSWTPEQAALHVSTETDKRLASWIAMRKATASDPLIWNNTPPVMRAKLGLHPPLTGDEVEAKRKEFHGSVADELLSGKSEPRDDGETAAARLSAVDDPAIKAKIATARLHGYSDDEILKFLGL
jgi:hypothetical protein